MLSLCLDCQNLCVTHYRLVGFVCRSGQFREVMCRLTVLFELWQICNRLCCSFAPDRDWWPLFAHSVSELKPRPTTSRSWIATGGLSPRRGQGVHVSFQKIARKNDSTGTPGRRTNVILVAACTSIASHAYVHHASVYGCAHRFGRHRLDVINGGARPGRCHRWAPDS